MKQMKLLPWFVGALFFGIGCYVSHRMVYLATEEPVKFWMTVLINTLFLLSIYCIGQILGRVVTYNIIKRRAGR